MQMQVSFYNNLTPLNSTCSELALLLSSLLMLSDRSLVGRASAKNCMLVSKMLWRWEQEVEHRICVTYASSPQTWRQLRGQSQRSSGPIVVGNLLGSCHLGEDGDGEFLRQMRSWPLCWFWVFLKWCFRCWKVVLCEWVRKCCREWISVTVILKRLINKRKDGLSWSSLSQQLKWLRWGVGCSWWWSGFDAAWWKCKLWLAKIKGVSLNLQVV